MANSHHRNSGPLGGLGRAGKDGSTVSSGPGPVFGAVSPHPTHHQVKRPFVKLNDEQAVARAAIDKATSKGHGKKTPKAEMDANARLISAAPDLLEALQGAIETADGTPGMSEAWWYSPARVAIDKATQGQGQ